MIGQHVAKYQAEKAAAEADALNGDTDAPRVDASADRPKKVETADLLAKMVELLAEIRTSGTSVESKERLALEAERLLLEQERLKREMPENKQSPGISVYSYPEGDYAHPKDPLKCKMFWIGYELNTDTLTPGEVELLNKLQPGVFRVTKADGTNIPFTVAAKHNDRFELEQLTMIFPCKDDQRQNHASMTSYLRQALGERIPSVDELLREVTRLKAEIAREKAGVLSPV